jgi:hypothetical protein
MKFLRLLIIASLLICIGIASPGYGASPLSKSGPYFVRARYITVPTPTLPSKDYRIQGKLYYPALDDVQYESGNLSYFPPDTSDAPYPVLIFLIGSNCNIEQYAWLFEHLCSYGYIVISLNETYLSSYEWLICNPVISGFSNPERYPSSLGLYYTPTYLEDINTVNSEGRLPLYPGATTGLLQGMIDLDRIAIAGHSFGGFQALMSSTTKLAETDVPDYANMKHLFAGLKACVTYGVHTISSGEPLPTAVNIPLLFIAAEKDAVGDGEVLENGELVQKSGYERMKLTFDQAIPVSTDKSRYFLGIKNANHFSIVLKPDPTVDISFLDTKEGVMPQDMAHQIFKEKITAFFNYYLKGDKSAYLSLSPAIVQKQWFVKDYYTK